MSDDAAAFDSACMMWTSNLMMESIVMLTQPWDSSMAVMDSPTIYHAVKQGLLVCPDYRRNDLKYFAPREIYESAVKGVSSEAILLGSLIREDPVQVAFSACRRGNSLAFLAARGVHRLQFVLEYDRFGGAHVSKPVADNDEWEKFDRLGSEWESYLHTLKSRSNHFCTAVHPLGIDFQDSLERDILNIICTDWQEIVSSGSDFPRYHCVFDMTNWEIRACK